MTGRFGWRWAGRSRPAPSSIGSPLTSSCTRSSRTSRRGGFRLAQRGLRHLSGIKRSRAGPQDALRIRRRVVPLETLATGFGRLDGQRAMVAYAESATAAEILCGELGTNVGAFLQNVGGGQSIDQALLDFQIQPNAFNAEWRRRVGLR